MSDRQTHRSIDPPNTSRSTAAYTSERDPQTSRSIDPPEIIRRWPYTDNLDTYYIIRDTHLYFTYEELGFYSPQFNAKITRGRSPISGPLQRYNTILETCEPYSLRVTAHPSVPIRSRSSCPPWSQRHQSTSVAILMDVIPHDTSLVGRHARQQ